MKLKNESYDIGKWVVIIFLPSSAVLLGGLAELYGWENGPICVGTINLITVFLGSILQISSMAYHDENNYWGGGPNDPKST